MFSPKPIFINDTDVFKSVKTLKGSKSEINHPLSVKSISVLEPIKSTISITRDSVEIEEDNFISSLKKYSGSDIKWIL